MRSSEMEGICSKMKLAYLKIGGNLSHFQHVNIRYAKNSRK